ncbi:MAG: cyclic nucleotide-binding domain-containing protein [Chloroflexota bacterium]
MSTVNLFKQVAEVETFPAGAIIFEQGEYGDVMYLVEEGEIEIMIGNQVVETVRKNGMVGEMALISDLPRSATAIAKTDCKLIPLNEQKFKMHVQLTPMFSLKVMKTMAHRMQAMNAQL